MQAKVYRIVINFIKEAPKTYNISTSIWEQKLACLKSKSLFIDDSEEEEENDSSSSSSLSEAEEEDLDMTLDLAIPDDDEVKIHSKVMINNSKDMRVCLYCFILVKVIKFISSYILFIIGE